MYRQLVYKDLVFNIENMMKQITSTYDKRKMKPMATQESDLLT